MGNRLTETDEALQTNTFTYDNENRLASDTNHAQEITNYTYDTNGNRLTATQPKQNGWTYTYDALNRLHTVANSLGHTTTYEYDANDNQTAQVDAESKRVEYAYDELNRRNQHTQIKATGNLVVASTYDENGNLASRTDAKNQTISYVYDELNRETSRSYPVDNGPFIDIQGIASQYDANNNIATITETKTGALGALSDLTSNTYDLLDRLKSSTQRGKAINYGYDHNGNRTSVSTAAGSTTYTFDNRNRIDTALNGGTTSYSYYADGKQQQITYPNGTQSRYSYDAADRVNDIVTETSANQTLIARYQYLFDSNGNRTEQQETQNGQLETTTYGYDSANRMESYSILAGATTTTTNYTFDAVSNRLTEITTENAVTTVDKSYAYDDTHWLDKVTDNLQTADIDYSYDPNGNTIQKLDNTQASPESTVFTYNSRDQLVQTQRGPPTSETQTLGQYDYNYAGLRTRHYQSERGNVQYFYDDQSVIEERSDSDALIAHYRYADRLLSLQTAAETSFYHHDALGSTTNLTDTAGGTKVSYKLDPWGHIREQVGSSVNRQVFTGQEMDEQTGLIYFGARFYDPDTARFLNQDSYLGESNEPPSLHRYLYAYGNPTVYVDLDGHKGLKLPKLKQRRDRDSFSPPPVIGQDGKFQDDVPPSFFGTKGESLLERLGDAIGKTIDQIRGVEGGIDYGAEAEEQRRKNLLDGHGPAPFITEEGDDLHVLPNPIQNPLPPLPGNIPEDVDTSLPGYPAQDQEREDPGGFIPVDPGVSNHTGDTSGVGLVDPGSTVMLNENSKEKKVSRKVRDQIDALRNGEEIVVSSVEEARDILNNMPELKPATQERLLPNPNGGIGNGFKDPKGTFRGDLINKQDPEAPVHPNVLNPEHANNPHYNIRLPNGDRAAIIIKPKTK